MRRSGLERAVGGEFPTGVVMVGFAILDELEAIVLGIAGEQCAPALLGDHGQAKLDRPASGGLIDVEHAQTGVVQVVQLDAHQSTSPAATRRSASSSGIASATCSVFAEVSG